MVFKQLFYSLLLIDFFGLFRPEAVELGFYDLNTPLGKLNTGIQFEADENDEGVEVKPDHDHDKRTDGSVNFIVGGKIIDIKGKPDRCENGKGSGQDRAGAQEIPALLVCRAVPVQ